MEKTIVNFEVWWLFAKVFFVEFGGMESIGSTSVSKNRIFLQFVEVCSLESFPLYDMHNNSLADMVLAIERKVRGREEGKKRGQTER